MSPPSPPLRVRRGGRLTETVILKSKEEKLSVRASLFCTGFFGYLQEGALASLQREGEKPEEGKCSSLERMRGQAIRWNTSSVG